MSVYVGAVPLLPNLVEYLIRHVPTGKGSEFPVRVFHHPLPPMFEDVVARMSTWP